MWLFFGCLELAEQLDLFPETAMASDEAQPDLDRDALAQLSHGLKPDAPGVDNVVSTAIAGEPVGAMLPVASTIGLDQNGRPIHSPPSLRLHQRISLYRI